MKDDSLDQFLHDSLNGHSSDFQSDWDAFSEKLENAQLDNFLADSLSTHETPSNDWNLFEAKLADSAAEFEILHEAFSSHETPVDDWAAFEAKLSATSPEDIFLKDSLANHETEVSDWAAFESKLNAPEDAADSLVEFAFAGHETAINDWYSFFFKFKFQWLTANSIGFMRSMSVAATVLVGLFCWWLIDSDVKSFESISYSAHSNSGSSSNAKENLESNSKKPESNSSTTASSKTSNSKSTANSHVVSDNTTASPSHSRTSSSSLESKSYSNYYHHNAQRLNKKAKGKSRNHSSSNYRNQPNQAKLSDNYLTRIERNNLSSNPLDSNGLGESSSIYSESNSTTSTHRIEKLSLKKSIVELPFKSVVLLMSSSDRKVELLRELKKVGYPQNFATLNINSLNFRELINYTANDDLNRNITVVSKGSKALFAPGLSLNLGYHKSLFKGVYGSATLNFSSFETRTLYDFETHEIPVIDSATNKILGYIPKDYEFSGVLSRKTTALGIQVGVGKSFNFGRVSLSPEVSFGVNRILSVSGSEISGITLKEVAVNQARINSSLFSYRFGLTAGYWITPKWGVDINVVSGRSWSNYRPQIGEHSDLGSIFGGGISFKYCLFNH